MRPSALERLERDPDRVGAGPVPGGDLGRHERTVRPGVPGGEVGHRALGRRGEHRGQSLRQGDAERVPEPCRVLHGRGAFLARHADADRPPVVQQRLEPRRGVAVAPRGDLVLAHRAQFAEEVVHAVRASRPPSRREPLQPEFDVVERARVQQLAQLLRAEELAEQVPVERERRRATFRERRVALVHVHGDPSEQQRLRERRGPVGIHRDQPGPARAEIGHHLAQGGHVEDVAEAFARGFEQHREVRMAGRLDQQVGAPLPLLPQRRPLARAASRQQQRAGRHLAEHGREHRGAREGGDDRLLDLLRAEHEIVDRDPFDRLGQPQHDAVVGPQHLRPRAEALLDPCLDRQRPRRVHA